MVAKILKKRVEFKGQNIQHLFKHSNTHISITHTI
jgi:hypothetical protein